MKSKLIAAILTLIMIFSLCSCSITINKQESTKTTDSATMPVTVQVAEPVSIQEELDYKNEGVGYGIYKLPEVYKSPNFKLITKSISEEAIIIAIYYAFSNDGYSVADISSIANALRASAYIGTMFFSNTGEISEETLANLGLDLNLLQELQRIDGNNLYYILSSDEDRYNNKEALTEDEIAIVNKAMSECTELMKNVVAVERTLPKLSFATVDFYGNPITSEECFSSNTVTLLNIWASYCYPCEREMPELVKANDILSKDGSQVLLCLYDTDDRNSEKYQDAIGLLERAGAGSLKCIIVNDEIKEQLDNSVPGFPTSFAVGSDGQILGDAYQGDRTAERFVNWINAHK